MLWIIFSFNGFLCRFLCPDDDFKAIDQFVQQHNTHPSRRAQQKNEKKEKTNHLFNEELYYVSTGSTTMSHSIPFNTYLVSAIQS